MVTKNCKRCGKEYEVPDNRVGRSSYCSWDCRKKRTLVTCQACGKTFLVKSSDAKRRKACSVECGIVVRAASRKKPETPDRTCWRCKRTLPVEQFNKGQKACRDCQRNLYADWYSANAEEQRRMQLERHQKARLELLNHYGGTPPRCACCGEGILAFLTVDHINQDGAKHRKQLRTSSTTTLYQWAKKNGFPKGFQVLCWNCNWGRHVNGGTCPHNSGGKNEPSTEHLRE
jgi:hypothetical protein